MMNAQHALVHLRSLNYSLVAYAKSNNWGTLDHLILSDRAGSRNVIIKFVCNGAHVLDVASQNILWRVK